MSHGEFASSSAGFTTWYSNMSSILCSSPKQGSVTPDDEEAASESVGTGPAGLAGPMQRVHPYEDWLEGFSAGLALLLEQRDHAGPNGDFDGVSIISYKPERCDSRAVALVQWTEEGVQGRIASVDDERRVKAIVPVGTRRVPLDFASMDLSIIYGDTGARHVKAKWKHHQAQSQLSEHLRRLFRMFSLAEGASDNELSECGNPLQCFICNSVQAKQLPLEPARCCPLCLLCSHDRCTSDVVEVLQHQGRSSVQGSDQAGQRCQPQLFGLPLCPPVAFSWPSAFQTTPRREQGSLRLRLEIQLVFDCVG